jgi:hypothetical protein
MASKKTTRPKKSRAPRPKPKAEEIDLDTRIDALDLALSDSTRAELARRGMSTVGDPVVYSEAELVEEGFSAANVREIVAALATLGLSLEAESAPKPPPKAKKAATPVVKRGKPRKKPPPDRTPSVIHEVAGVGDVVGVLEFAGDGLARWLEHETDKGVDCVHDGNNSMFNLSEVMERDPAVTRSILDAATDAGKEFLADIPDDALTPFAARIVGNRVVLLGAPGRDNADAIDLLTVFLDAADYGARGEVFFLGTYAWDFVAIVGDGHSAVEYAGGADATTDPTPRDLPIPPKQLAEIVAKTFDVSAADVASRLAGPYPEGF